MSIPPPTPTHTSPQPAPTQNNRVLHALACHQHGTPALWPFVTVGHPGTACLPDLLMALQEAGVSGVELGLPYSDSIADGPVIQTSFHHALSRGLHIDDAFAAVARARARGVSLPLIAMVSYSIVHRRDPAAFCAAAAAAGIDGLIVPDLPLEAAGELLEHAQVSRLVVNLLVSPAAGTDRQLAIARATTGFVYYMSVVGITGERGQLADSLNAAVAQLRQASGRPVCVGFGISTPQQVADVCQAADGAIVGSALVRRMQQSIDAGHPEARTVAVAAAFCRFLLGREPDQSL